MSSTVLSIEEKEKILRTLESDREFRYALMGLLGFTEVLDRITKLEGKFAELAERMARLEERFLQLEERVAKLEERFAELAERMARLEERFIKLEERVARLEERFLQLEERVAKLEERFAELAERMARLEERFIKLEERVARLEERFLQLEERVAKLEERFLMVEEELRDLRRVTVALAHRFGIITEEGFRDAMKYVISDILGVAEVSRWVYHDERGVVYGRPSLVEVDLVVRDKEHILIEIKSRVDKGDLLELYRVGQLYEEVNGVKPKLILVYGFMARGTRELAEKLGIELRPMVTEG